VEPSEGRGKVVDLLVEATSYDQVGETRWQGVKITIEFIAYLERGEKRGERRVLC
jgi:hypothetical protein